MVVVTLAGGLGNQLFQYATGFSLAKKNNSFLILDCSEYYLNNKHADKDIIKFRLNEVIRLDNLIIIKSRYISQLIRAFFKIFDIFSFRKIKYLRINEHEYFKYQYIPKASNYFLNGYWQNLRYFKNDINEILDKFKIKKNNKIFSDYTSVHIRRGDYLSTKFDICDKDFFNRSLKFLNKKKVKKKDHVLFFSLDKEWVKNNFDLKKYNYQIIANKKKPIDDFWLMAQSQNIIISNSTFSWWAALLISRNKKKTIICPKYWGNMINYNKIDIYPEDWIKL